MKFSLPEHPRCASVFQMRSRERDFYFAATGKNVCVDSGREFVKYFVAFVWMCVFVHSLASFVNTKQANNV